MRLSLESLVSEKNLLGGSIFRYSFGSFGDGVLRQFSGKQEPDCRLYFPRCNSRSLIVVGEPARFRGNSFENIVNERIHYGHGLGWNTGVRMNLLENFVYVNAVTLLPLTFPLLIALGNRFLSFASLLRGFTRSFRSHDDDQYERISHPGLL